MSMEQESRGILKGNMAGFTDLYFARPFVAAKGQKSSQNR